MYAPAHTHTHTYTYTHTHIDTLSLVSLAVPHDTVLSGRLQNIVL